jgi:hypothetical protein
VGGSQPGDYVLAPHLDIERAWVELGVGVKIGSEAGHIGIDAVG